jgi:O-antigen biosynthesis protein
MTGIIDGTIRSHLGLIDARTIAGFVCDDARPGLKFVVEILTDGVPLTAIIADTFSPTLRAMGQADAYHGFIQPLAANLATTTRIVSARLANIGIPVGHPLDLDRSPKLDPMLSAPGLVEEVVGRSVRGWVLANAHGTTLVRAISAGEEIAATVARIWTSTSIGGEIRPVLAFEIKIPSELTDGEMHTLEIVNDRGTSLAGSPFSINVAKS